VTFVLTVLPLSTERELSPREITAIRAGFEQWRDTPDGVVILSARVEHATSFDIDLPAAEPGGES
jgi:hypothetical protein